jgi:hypothetical protein
MRIRLEVNDSLVKVYCEIPTQDLKKYRQWFIWGITATLPILVSYSTAIKLIPPSTLPLSPSNNQEELRK